MRCAFCGRSYVHHLSKLFVPLPDCPQNVACVVCIGNIGRKLFFNAQSIITVISTRWKYWN